MAFDNRESLERQDGGAVFARAPIFRLNFAVSILLIYSAMAAIAASDNPYASLGGMVMVVPVAVYALAEWVATIRSNRGVERQLGWTNLAGGGFVTFGVVTNIGDALMVDEPVDGVFLFYFSLIGGAITTYLTLTGLARLRWTKAVAAETKRRQADAGAPNPKFN